MGAPARKHPPAPGSDPSSPANCSAAIATLSHGTEARGRPLAGQVQSTTLPTVIHELGARRATGVLTVSSAATRKNVYLRDGQVLFATSSDRDDRFCQVLVREGVIAVKSLLRALDLSLATRDRLGEVLIRNKAMTQRDVDKWVKVQVRGIVLGLFNCTSGTWSFEEGPVPAEMIALDASGDAVVIEGVRQVSSWARVYEEVGGLNAEYLATRRAGEIAAGLPLRPGERKLLRMCAEPTSLGEMCEASRLGDFQACRSVWGLLIVGALMKS